MTTSILVVDDASLVRAQLRGALRKVDFVVLEAGDGVEALAQLEANAASVKLIICDIHMPNMNGLELLERLHATGSTTPVIILTAEADPEIIRRAKALGARGWLMKPLKLDHMAAMVTKVIAASAEASPG
jgi:two-component system, chemotaxis family, chemotaxis protein CheY